MVLVAALGDVVQEGGDIERAPIVDGAHDLARHGMIDRELAALDAGEEADGAEQMLVHREVVIHVELHHRHDAAEVADEAAEHAGLVHLAQRAFGVASVGQKPHEQTVGGRIAAQIVVDQPEVRPDLPQDLGREGRLVLVGEDEQADEIDRVLDEGVLVHGRDAAVLDAEVRGAAQLGAAAPAERREQRVQRRHRLQLLELERRADDPRELPDLLGDEEVVLHEALDGAQAGVAAIAEPLGHRPLEVEAQALLGAVGEEMQVTAHRPQEGLAAAEAAIFMAREDAGLDELLLGLVGIKVLGEPVQRVQVAQAAGAFLDVGLDEIARGAGA